jgi:hypothetical protein
LLQSPGYRGKAWGAYLSGKYRLQDQAVAALLRALRGLTANTLAGNSPEFSVIQATLDALIQLGYRVDGADLPPFQKQWANEVPILLAQDPQANRAALLAIICWWLPGVQVSPRACCPRPRLPTCSM